MGKKTTVRDIAKAANVSVATVSYVLNDRADKKISEATKKKVLQVANLLNYQIAPRMIAPSAVSRPTIGLAYCPREDAPARTQETMTLLRLLAERFHRMGHVTLLLPLDEAEKKPPVETLDGIIVIDLAEATFKRMANDYLVPILCLDMRINDFLFYQIYTDFDAMIVSVKEQLGDDFYFFADAPQNERYLEYLRDTVPDGRLCFFSEWEEEKLHDLRGKRVAALGTLLGLALRPYVKSRDMLVITQDEDSAGLLGSVRTLPSEIEKKANLAMNIMLNALEKKFDVKHEYRV